MFTVFYAQTLKDGTRARNSETFETMEAAKSRFLLELAQVTIAPNLKSVKAMIFDDDCKVHAYDNTELPEEVMPATEGAIPAA